MPKPKPEDPNRQRDGDQPDEFLLDKFACICHGTFICPYHARVKDERKDSIILCSRHGDQRLKVTHEHVSGRDSYPHSIYVGQRLPECRECPPLLYVVDPAVSQSFLSMREVAKTRFEQRVHGGGARPLSKRGEDDDVDEQDSARGGTGDELGGVHPDQAGPDGVQDGQRDREPEEEAGSD